jgi:uncharacterized membrane protein YphA (DoxX/SURF4 family)
MSKLAPNHQNSSQEPSTDMTNDPRSLDLVREQTNKVENVLDTLSRPVKPFLSVIGRFLVVATYFENAIRIAMEWDDQLIYLEDFRKISPRISLLFLAGNCIAMCTCAIFILAAKYSDAAVAGLAAVTVAEAYVYGLLFNLNFFLHNLLVMSGLLMSLSTDWIQKSKAFAGLLLINNNDRRRYLHLASRVLLVFLYIGFVYNGPWSICRAAVAIVGFVACIMIAVGFQSKFSAIMLVVILSMLNLLVNNFWMLHPEHPSRDFFKYDFLQTLSVAGGVILLMNSGLDIDGTKDDDRKYDWGRGSRKSSAREEVV